MEIWCEIYFRKENNKNRTASSLISPNNFMILLCLWIRTWISLKNLPLKSAVAYRMPWQMATFSYCVSICEESLKQEKKYFFTLDHFRHLECKCHRDFPLQQLYARLEWATTHWDKVSFSVIQSYFDHHLEVFAFILMIQFHTLWFDIFFVSIEKKLSKWRAKKV